MRVLNILFATLFWLSIRINGDDDGADISALLVAMDTAASDAAYDANKAFAVYRSCQDVSRSRMDPNAIDGQFERIYTPTFGALPPPKKDARDRKRKVKRVAIGFFGLTRSLRKTVCNLAEMILRPLIDERVEIDVYVHTYKLRRLRKSTKNKVEGHGAELDVNEWKMLPFVRDVQVDDQHEVEVSLDTSKFKPPIEDPRTSCVPSPMLKGKRDGCCLPELEFHRFQFCSYLNYSPPSSALEKLRAKYGSEENICADPSYAEAAADEECCNLRRERKADDNGERPKGTPYGWGSCPKEHEGPLRNVVLQYTSLERLAALVNKSGRTYDIVMYLRPDVAYLSSLDFSELEVLLEFSRRTGKEAAAFPLWGSSGGLNDRFAFGTPGAMNLYAHRLEPAQRFIRHTGHGLKPEQLLYHLMVRKDIPDETMELHTDSHETLAVFWSMATFVRVRNACSVQLLANVSQEFAGCFVATQDCTSFPFLVNQRGADLFLPASRQHRFDGTLAGAVEGDNLPQSQYDNVHWKRQLLCSRPPRGNAITRLAQKLLIQNVSPATAPSLRAWLNRNNYDFKELDPSVAYAISSLHGVAKKAVEQDVRFHPMEYTRVSGWGLPCCIDAAFHLELRRICRSEKIEQDFTKPQHPLLGKQLDSSAAHLDAEVGTREHQKAYLTLCCSEDQYVDE